MGLIVGFTRGCPLLRFTEFVLQNTSKRYSCWDSMRSAPITVSVAFVHGILSGVRALGEPCDCWLQHAGIAKELLDLPDARITAEQYLSLFQVLIEARDDEGLGFFSRRLRRGSFAVAMRSALLSKTVESGLKRTCQAIAFLQDDMCFNVLHENGLTGIHITVPESYGADRLFVYGWMMRMLSRYVVWLHGGRIKAFGFDFAYPAPSFADEYEKLFSGRVRFGQERAVMWYGTENLAAPMRRDAVAMHEFLLQTPRIVIIPRRHDDETSDRIRNYLQQVRPLWPDLPATASALHMSISTLQRQLANEETSFQIVKDQLRRDLAIMRLSTSAVPLAVLAGELGFSDQAVFQRAFKMWTGSAPGAYRQNPKTLPVPPSSTAASK